MPAAETKTVLGPIGIALAIVLCATPAFGVGDLVWAGAIGGPFGDEGWGVAVDSSGNVYTTGFFEGTVDFDPGPGAFTLSAVGNSDIFISKLDSSGAFVWAKAIGSTYADSAAGLALDPSDNVYVTGAFAGTADFDPGPGVFNRSGSIFGGDFFVLKLDTDGNFLWAKTMGGPGLDESTGIAVDSSGNVHITGSFEGTVDFDPGPGALDLSSNGMLDIFVLKLDTNGNSLWAKVLGSGGTQYGTGLAVDGAGNVYATGGFSSTVDFDPGAGVYNLSAVGRWDVYVLKLDSNGGFIWADAMGGLGHDQGNGITVDGSGNSYTTGWFESRADFDPGAGSRNLRSRGRNDLFVLKLDSGGNLAWAASFGGAENDAGNGIAVDGPGNAYVTGFFQVTADFYPGSGTYELTAVGNGDLFALKLDSAGRLVWATAMGGANSDVGRSLAIDGSGYLHATGLFEGTADFDPATGVANLTASGGRDSFVLKLGTTGPSVSMASGVPNPTNTSPIPIAVTFSSPVTNFTAGDIAAGSGTVSNFAGTAASYTFDLTPLGDGLVTADIPPAAAEELVTGFTNSAAIQFRRTFDTGGPIVSIGPPSPGLTTTGPVSYAVTYTDADSVTLGAGDVTLNTTGTANGTVSVSGAGTLARTVTLSSIGGGGTLAISISAGTALDALGNPADSAGPSSPFTVDGTPPTLVIGPPVPSGPGPDSVTFFVTYGRANSVTLQPGDVTLNVTGTVTGTLRVFGSGTTQRLVAISGITGIGTVGISIAAGTATNAIGSTAPAAGPSAVFTVTGPPPSPIPVMPAANLPSLLLTLLILAGLACFALRRI